MAKLIAIVIFGQNQISNYKYTQAQKLSSFSKQCTDVQALMKLHLQNLHKAKASWLVYLHSTSNQV